MRNYVRISYSSSDVRDSDVFLCERSGGRPEKAENRCCEICTRSVCWLTHVLVLLSLYGSYSAGVYGVFV